MEDIRKDLMAASDQLKIPLSEYVPRPDHLVSDIVLFGFCHDTSDCVSAVLEQSQPSLYRTSYLLARGAFEASQDALLLAGDSDNYDRNGALAYAIELVELEQLQNRWKKPGEEWGTPELLLRPFTPPEVTVESEIPRLEAVSAGSSVHLTSAIVEARRKNRTHQHWSGLSRKKIAERIVYLVDDIDERTAEAADAFYGMLSVHSHPRLRAWTRKFGQSESGALRFEGNPHDEFLPLGFSLVAAIQAVHALELRLVLDQHEGDINEPINA